MYDQIKAWYDRPESAAFIREHAWCFAREPSPSPPPTNVAYACCVVDAVYFHLMTLTGERGSTARSGGQDRACQDAVRVFTTIDPAKREREIASWSSDEQRRVLSRGTRLSIRLKVGLACREDQPPRWLTQCIETVASTLANRGLSVAASQGSVFRRTTWIEKVTDGVLTSAQLRMSVREGRLKQHKQQRPGAPLLVNLLEVVELHGEVKHLLLNDDGSPFEYTAPKRRTAKNGEERRRRAKK